MGKGEYGRRGKAGRTKREREQCAKWREGQRERDRRIWGKEEQGGREGEREGVRENVREEEGEREEGGRETEKWRQARVRKSER